MNVTDKNSMYGNDKEFWKIILLLNIIFLFIIIYFLIYLESKDIIAADTAKHIEYMQQFFKGEIYIPHPLWHIGTYYTSKIFGIDYDTGASIFTAFLVSLYSVIIYNIAKYIDQRDSYEKWYLITLISLTIGPFFIMGIYPKIYIGTGSPSVWHNVTLLMVKPFALLSIFYVINFLNNARFSNFVFAILVTIISVFAKPSYIIVFIPSLVLYMLLKRYLDKNRMIFLSTIIILSVLILSYQFTHEFGKDGKSSVILDCFGVWSLYTPSIIYSIAMALGLPILITISDFKNIKQNEYIKFSWFLVLFSIIMFACFAESGRNYTYGNFSWSWNLSLSMIYIFTIIEFFKYYYSISAIYRYSILIIMLYQVYVGWYFLLEMFNGVGYGAVLSKFPLFQ